MADRRRGRPRKEHSVSGSVPNYALYLALIYKAGGNVSKAARDWGHEGTKSFYDALKRLRKQINANIPKGDHDHDDLFAHDKDSQTVTWTEQGLKLVRIGEQVLRTKKRYEDEEKKTCLRNAHLAKCKTPLYPHTQILVTLPARKSKLEIIYACSSCEMIMRNFLTVEFLKWRDDHPELYSTAPLAFFEIDETGRKLV